MARPEKARFKAGEEVMYAAAFLRSIKAYDAETALRKGVVTESTFMSGKEWVRVRWADTPEGAKLVLGDNLKLARAPDLTP